MSSLVSAPLSASLLGLIGLALLVGIKHGFDADHLAAIDGLARVHASVGRRRLARASGALFSLGHSAVVLLAALVLKDRVSALPAWFDGAGACLSIALLVVLGVVNLREACSPVGSPRGVVAPWLLNSTLARRPDSGLAIGALFALSLDTLAGAAWFGLAGARQGGGGAVVLLALAFCAGMITADTVNGLWIARLIQRSQAFAQQASRLFAAGVATIALMVAGLGATRLAWPAADAWADAHALVLGVAVVFVAYTAFIAARALSRSRASAPRACA